MKAGRLSQAGRIARLRGFTLIELLVTISIVAILAMVATPSFNEAVINHRLTSVSNNFVASANLARSEAIKRNSRMTLCKSANGSDCVTTGGWQQGWIIFQDYTNESTVLTNNNGVVNISEVIVHKEGALPADLLMSGNSSVVDYVSFSASGATELLSGAFQSGTLTLCSQSALGRLGRKLIVNSAGRLRVTKDPSDCA